MRARNASIRKEMTGSVFQSFGRRSHCFKTEVTARRASTTFVRTWNTSSRTSASPRLGTWRSYWTRQVRAGECLHAQCTIHVPVCLDSLLQEAEALVSTGFWTRWSRRCMSQSWRGKCGVPSDVSSLEHPFLLLLQLYYEKQSSRNADKWNTWTDLQSVRNTWSHHLPIHVIITDSISSTSTRVCKWISRNYCHVVRTKASVQCITQKEIVILI